MARKSGPVLELLLRVDRRSSDPLHTQIERELRSAINDGRLATGTPLPSSRALADALAVARSVVIEAYRQLSAEGYLQARTGSGTTVAADAVSQPRAGATAGDGRPVPTYNFHPGLPDLAAFPTAAWTNCLQRALRRASHSTLGYPDPRGEPALREVLARYLGRARGTFSGPDDVLVCSGIVQGLGLVCQALRANGARRVAVEDPGWDVHRAVVRRAGLEVVGVPVDAEGIRVGELARHQVQCVVVTPAHQFPTGTVLSAQRRAALLDWARQNDAIVFEDDYDAEFRFDHQPIGVLQGLARDRVVYAGSASKILAPGLRLGWLVVPESLSGSVRREKRYTDLGSDVPAQLALVDFVERGELDRHLRRSRKSYRARRDALLEALNAHLPDARIEGAAAGLHALALLPDDADEGAITERAAARGVSVCGLSRYRMQPAQRPPGFVLGYGNLSEAMIERGISELARARSESSGLRAYTCE